MDLTKDIIPQKYFYGLLFAFLGFSMIGIIWLGFTEVETFDQLFDASEVDAGETIVYSIGPLTLSKTNVDDTLYTYVSVSDLSYTPSPSKKADILSSSLANTKMLGLYSHPSFMINAEERSFWRSQFYLHMGFTFGSLFIFMAFILGFSIINIKQKQKLFTKEVYRWVYGFYFMIIAGFIIYPIIYGRMIYFLNAEFYLGETLTSGIADEPLFALGILIFLIIFLQKAIPMQKDQDLTV